MNKPRSCGVLYFLVILPLTVELAFQPCDEVHTQRYTFEACVLLDLEYKNIVFIILSEGLIFFLFRNANHICLTTRLSLSC